MSINEVRYLPECGSTNAYVKEHFEEFGPVAAVYTAPTGPNSSKCSFIYALVLPHSGR